MQSSNIIIGGKMSVKNLAIKQNGGVCNVGEIADHTEVDIQEYDNSLNFIIKKVGTGVKFKGLIAGMTFEFENELPKDVEKQLDDAGVIYSVKKTSEQKDLPLPSSAQSLATNCVSKQMAPLKTDSERKDQSNELIMPGIQQKDPFVLLVPSKSSVSLPDVSAVGGITLFSQGSLETGALQSEGSIVIKAKGKVATGKVKGESLIIRNNC